MRAQLLACARAHCVVHVRKPYVSHARNNESTNVPFAPDSCMVQRNTMPFIAVRRVMLGISLLSGLCSVARPAPAHGGPPSVVGIVAADANGPTVVLVNEGLGLKRD